MQKLVKTYWPIAIILLIVLIILTRFIAPAPPKTLNFASGSPDGAYSMTASDYARVFGDQGFTLSVINTSGSGDNLDMLRSGKVSAAIVQGGTSQLDDKTKLKSLGAIFYEPLWVFFRADVAPASADEIDIRSLKNLKIAAGSPTSGTRALTKQLLDQNGMQAELHDLTGEAGAKALKAGQIDVLVSVSAPNAPFVRDLLADPNVQVLSFKRALAYERRTPYLKRVIFPEGGLDLQNNLPSTPIELIAPAAEVVVREDLHPALQSLLLEAMMQTHRGGTLLSAPGTFPTPDRIDLPLSEEAERYYERGPSFLRRVFPFAVANFLERAWVLAIPLITLGFPLVRAAPPIYRWRTRRKIYIWYKDLRLLEARGRSATTSQERQEISIELSELQAEVGRVEVPESYTDELYRLRSHILFVNELIQNLDKKAKARRTPAKSEN